MFLVVKRRTLVAAALALTVLTVGALRFLSAARPAFAPAAPRAARTFVIDAGHGGEDGGAVAADGTAESAINLAVAVRLEALLALLGEDTAMTRREDVSIYSDGAATLRQKKTSDLRNRAALVRGTPNAVLVSVHQNSLPGVPSVRGAQVFYGREAAGEALAAAVQAALNKAINTGNEKQAKQIDPSIYLMKHADCPAILVECGFLSNAQEAALLQTPAHQTRLAVAVAAGILSADPQGREGS